MPLRFNGGNWETPDDARTALGGTMSHILLLTNSTGSSVDVLPALELLNHRVHILPAEPTALLEAEPCDVVLLDARKDLVGARSLTQLLKATGLSAPLMLILTEGGMAAVSAAWAADDIVLESAGPPRWKPGSAWHWPAPVRQDEDADSEIRAAGVVIDEASYTARVNGAALNLTYQGIRAAEVPGPAPRPGLHPRSSCSPKSGVTTTTAAPAPWTSTSGGCGPSSAPTTRT